MDTYERPTITVPDSEPPTELVIEDLVVGDGTEAVSGAQVNVEINATGETVPVSLSGPTTIHRGPVGDADQDGRDDIQTEIIQPGQCIMGAL